MEHARLVKNTQDLTAQIEIAFLIHAIPSLKSKTIEAFAEIAKSISELIRKE